MSARTTIALDAMGGDRAPEIVVRGANIALQRHPDTHFLLFGSEAKIAPLLKRLPRLAHQGRGRGRLAHDRHRPGADREQEAHRRVARPRDAQQPLARSPRIVADAAMQ